MKAYVFGGMLVLSAALAACSSSGDGDTGAGGSGGSGSGGSGSGEGGSTTGSPTSTTGTTTPATTSTTATTASGQIECSLTSFFEETAGACDTCFLGACCAEAEACVADLNAGGTDCADPATGQFTDGPLADAVFACQEANCAEECGGGGICGTPLGYNDEGVDSCIEGSCCDEFVACVGQDGSNSAACQACLDAGSGALCDPFLACTDEAGCFGFQVCDSILLLEDGAAAECLGTNCCDETNACFGEDQASFDACVACLEAGATDPLCSGLAACDETNACGLLQEG